MLTVPVSFNVVPFPAAIVEVPEKLIELARLTFAVASSSPPLKETVPAPNAPEFPTSRTPPVTATLPIEFASLSDTKPELTVSVPATVSVPVFSRSAASGASKVSEFAVGKIVERNVLKPIEMPAPTVTM